MKGIIYYYSNTGNTKLACEAIVKALSPAEFHLCDIAGESNINPESYDIVGFATFTDFWGPPKLLQSFIESLPQSKGKAAFLLNTYAALSGSALLTMADLVCVKGFKVVAGHSLHMPQSFPPNIALGFTSANSPNPKELNRFYDFINGLANIVRDIQNHREIKSVKFKVGLFNSIIPKPPRTKARETMGEKLIDQALCTRCGKCVKGCPYGAIEMKKFPIFDMEKCYGCWSCFNHCLTKAIYTNKLRGKGHYSYPKDALRYKLLK